STIVAMTAANSAIASTTSGFGSLPNVDASNAPILLPEATFGGSGIPNDTLSWKRFDLGNGDFLTMAMSATRRFQNPALSNDGNGTYFATTGSNDGTPGSASGLLGAKWNFNTYLNLETSNSNLLSDYDLDFFYDFDPGTDTADADLGQVDLSVALFGSGTFSEGSQNLLFGFLAVDVPFLQDAPDGPFNPNAVGEYTFKLRAGLVGGGGEETLEINVNVVPVPGALPLLATAFGIAALVKRRSTRA
ncbi:MAG: hypothetical protein AAF676_15690, partial [Pseudomonadota bacterium]